MRKPINFYVDKKVTIWVREHHTVETDDTDGLILELQQIIKDGDTDDIDDKFSSFKEQEFLFGSQSDMTVFENFGDATIEILVDDEIVATNCKL